MAAHYAPGRALRDPKGSARGLCYTTTRDTAKVHAGYRSVTGTARLKGTTALDAAPCVRGVVAWIG